MGMGCPDIQENRGDYINFNVTVCIVVCSIQKTEAIIIIRVVFLMFTYILLQNSSSVKYILLKHNHTRVLMFTHLKFIGDLAM